MKVLVATPMYGGMCTGEYARSMTGVVSELAAQGVSVSFAFLYNDSLITNARNKLATIFMEHDFTHLMFIDADIGFQPSDIVSLIKTDKEVIAGIYPKKRINWGRVESAVKSGVSTEELQFHTGDLVVSLVDHERERVVKLSDPVEVFGAGTGFMLIKREVLEALKDKVDTYLDGDGTQLYEYFFLVKDPELKQQLTEDYAFCRLCRINGIKIHIAPWVRLSHTGSYIFTGQPIPARA